MIAVGQFLVTRSDLSFSYENIRLGRIVLINSTMGCQSDTFITIEVPDWGRCGTRIYVLMRSSRTDAICCDRILLWSRDLSRSRSRIITI